MSEMVERVARMINPDAWLPERENVITGITIVDGQNPTVIFGREDKSKQRSNSLATARVAIASMREPTEAMESAGWEGIYAQVDKGCKKIYQDMIDEALK
jgi:hypothetical protein